MFCSIGTLPRALSACLAAVTLALSVGGSALGATDVPSNNDATRAPPMALEVRGDAIEPTALRIALSEETGRDIVLKSGSSELNTGGTITVSHLPETGELVVSFEHDGRVITRMIEASPEPERLLADTVLLASNLVHEQVALPAPAAEPAPPPASPTPPAKEPEPEYRIATAGLFYPLATHYGAPDVTTGFDLNVIYSRVGAVEGGQIGGVNAVARDRHARLRGFQLAYLMNVVDGDAAGVQLASLLNQASGDARVWQGAFGVNLSERSLSGAQTAFLFNSANRVRGLQAGLINRAGDLDGVQVGLVNIGEHVRGVTIGLINIADDIDGVPIAPFSVTRSGGVHPTVWAGTNGLGNVGVKLSTRSTYTLFFGSYHEAFDLQFLGGGFAAGGRIGLGGDFYSDIDVAGTYLVAPSSSTDAETDRSYHEQVVQPRLRAMLAYRALAHLGLFAGVSATGQIRSELGWDRITASVGPEFFGGLEL